MNAIFKKIIAGGSLTTILVGLVMELSSQIKSVEARISTINQDIAVLQKSDSVRDEQSRRIYKKLDIIESDIKTLLQRK